MYGSAEDMLLLISLVGTIRVGNVLVMIVGGRPTEVGRVSGLPDGQGARMLV